MHFFLDQDVSLLTCRLLRKAGHACVRASEVGLSRAPDERILTEAHARTSILVTRDKGFGSLVFLSGQPSSGVVLLRYQPDQIAAAHAELLRLLRENAFDRLQGSFITVEPDQYRVRHLRRSAPDA